MRIFISVHVPKTGGTSFRLMLQKFFGKGFYQDYTWEDRPQFMVDGIDEMTDKEIRSALKGVECIHGHFNVNKYVRLRDVKGVEPVFITWVRDPVQRALSTYYYLRTLNTPENQQEDWERLARNLTLLEFYTQTNYGKNRQFAQLRFLSPDEYDFFGVTERYEESIAVFRHKYFPRKGRIRIPHVQKNTQRKGKYYEVEPDLRRILESSNELDSVLYQYAQAWLTGASGMI